MAAIAISQSIHSEYLTNLGYSFPQHCAKSNSTRNLVEISLHLNYHTEKIKKEKKKKRKNLKNLKRNKEK